MSGVFDNPAETLKRLGKLEEDVNFLRQHVVAVDYVLGLLIESVSTVEAVTRDMTVTNVFYEALDEVADKPGPNRAITMHARILAGGLNARSNVTSKRRRPKTR